MNGDCEGDDDGGDGDLDVDDEQVVIQVQDCLLKTPTTPSPKEEKKAF